MQTAFRRFPPGNRAQRLGQRLADKIDMGFGRGTCGLRLALDNRAVNGGMLVEQQATGCGHGLEFAQVEADVVVHQAQQSGRQVAEQHVVRSVADRLAPPPASEPAV